MAESATSRKATVKGRGSQTGLRVETEEVDVVTAALQQQLLLVLRACCVSQSVICVDFRLGCQQKCAVVLRMSAVG